MKRLILLSVLLGVLPCIGCSSTQPQAAADVRKTDPDWYTKPENSRVPFKVTNSYSFRDQRDALVDDIDARDEAVQQIEAK